MNVKKILFIIHHDWRWIKQRSHHLIEELALYPNVEIATIYKYQIPNRSGLTQNKKVGLTIPAIFLPFALYKVNILRFLSKAIFKPLIYVFIKIKGINVIIYTHPLLHQYIPKSVFSIYDLHDDNEEFYAEISFRNIIKNQNIAALNSSNKTVYSSDYLLQKYPSKRPHLIRNGHSLPPPSYDLNNSIKKRKIVYFGTVSSWFDIDILMYVANSLPAITFDIIGPVDIILPDIIPENVVFHGKMSHSEMLGFSKDATAFIMPFIVNELIRGVDPVKLYEYLHFGKPIFSVYYDEISRFSQLINFYYKREQLLSDLQTKIDSFQDLEMISKFMEQNTWRSRAKQYLEVICDD